MFFQEPCPLRLADFDRNGNLSLEGILQILETAGTHHADSVGDHLIEGSQAGIAWILTEWRVQIVRPTDTREKLTITTWSYDNTPQGPVQRGIVITGEGNDDVIRAEAKFVLLNLETGRLTRISEELYNAYQPEKRVVFEDQKGRIPEPAAFDLEREVPLRKSDIDYNGHMHNTRYMELAAEVLPVSSDDGERISEFRVVYRRAVQGTSPVTVKRCDTENGYLVCIYQEEKLCTMAEIRKGA